MGVYILHFLEPYKHAAHYTGFSPEVQARVNAHLNGKGARLTEVVHEAGIDMILVRVWQEGDRYFERKLKNGHVKRHCPICQGLGVQLPLLPGEMAFVPSSQEEDAITSLTWEVAESQLNFDDFNLELRGKELETFLDEMDRQWLAKQGIDVEAELEDQIEGRLDEEYWARGSW